MTDSERLAEALRLNAVLNELVQTLASRCAAQSELLARAAARSHPPGVAEALAALAPLAELVRGWDDGALPAAALYPVPLGDLRRCARVVAKLTHATRAGEMT